MSKYSITLLTLQTDTQTLTKTNTEFQGSQASNFPQAVTLLHSHQPQMKSLCPLYSDNWALDLTP